MKKIFPYLLFASAILSVVGCRIDPAVYTQPDALYFGADSIAYSFALYPNKVQDTLHIPVNVLGKPVGTARPISLSMVNGAQYNAVAGKHYQLLPNTVMPANAVTTTVPVVVYRTPDLDDNVVKFAFTINTNTDFSGEAITANKTIIVNLAYIQKPASWGTLVGTPFAGWSGNFGTWTKTKYKIILAALYNPTTGTTTTEFPLANHIQPPIAYTQAVTTVKNYILTNYPGNYGFGGATLRDPDANNALIQVGPANY